MWPPGAIEFLRELEENNDRDWFKANRGRYDSELVEPARELAAELAHLGEPHMFRPYNDTRFHMRPPIKEQLGLNRPLWIQYLDWAWRLVQGDWGKSFRDGAPVLTVIGRHLFATLLLMGTSTVIAMAIGTWIGIRGATHRYSMFDYVATIGAMVALSIPTFWFGLVGIYVFSLRLGWLPAVFLGLFGVPYCWRLLRG